MHATRDVTRVLLRHGTSLGFSISLSRSRPALSRRPSPLFTYQPPNELISVFPLVLIPVYLVPLAVLLHLASLAKLHRRLAPMATASA